MTFQQRDKQYLWHPLTQHQTSDDRIAIVKAKGSILTDEFGKEYIDGFASWYTAMYGHCNELILERIRDQMEQLNHVIFTGFTHPPAVELSEQLIKMLPTNQKKLFFSDNGSTSVDVAIKIAYQYFYNQSTKKSKIVAFENGFHGDTFGAMSASGLSVYNGAFEQLFLEVDRITVPTKENIEKVLEEVQRLCATKEIACFIYEPIVQGAAGMNIYEAELLEQILKVFKRYNVLLIADEVMTGFGKTSTDFASNQMQTQPDIICLSKALTAGFVPMAITSCTEKIYNAFLSDDIKKGFFHGHTYTANPIACTAALANIELYNSNEIQIRREKIMQSHNEFAQELKTKTSVLNVRNEGMILAFELDVKMSRYGNLRNNLYKFFMSEGVCLRPLGNTIYTLPAFTIEEHELSKIYHTIEKSVSKFCS